MNFPQPYHQPPPRPGNFFPPMSYPQQYQQQPQYQQPAQMAMSPQQPALSQQLRSQLLSGRVYLNDMYFGDEGAQRLAREIKQTNCQDVQVIEIRGNNISATGFEVLFQAFLEQLVGVKAISIEWNQLGSSPKGMQALEELVMKRDSITFLDLRNNKIGGPEQCEIIARIIRSAKNLKTLDLRWNELGNQCAQTILNSLKSNNTLMSLELSGNSINNDLMKKFQDLIVRNRERSSKPMSSGKKQLRASQFDPISERNESELDDQDFNDRQYAELPQSQVLNNPHKLQSNVLNETKYAVNNLEQVLIHERKLGAEMRQRLEKEIEGLKNQDYHRLSQLKSVEQQLQVVMQQNQFLKLELERSNKELEIVQNANGQQLDSQEGKLQQHQYELDQQEAKHKRNIERLLREQEMIVENVNKELNQKIARLEQQKQQLEDTNSQLISELKLAEEESVKSKLEHDEDIRNITERVTQEEFRRYQNTLRVLETRLAQLEQQRVKSLTKATETINDAKKKEETMSTDLIKTKEELKEIEIENKDLEHRNNEYMLIVEKYKHEAELKDNISSKLENEINTLNTIIESKKEEHSHQMQALRMQNEKEINDYEKNKEASKIKITEIETLLRETHNENLRLRQDYTRLSNLLQTAVSKEIFQTFSDNHYF